MLCLAGVKKRARPVAIRHVSQRRKIASLKTVVRLALNHEIHSGNGDRYHVIVRLPEKNVSG
jgi:hypothetical protein